MNLRARPRALPLVFAFARRVTLFQLITLVIKVTTLCTSTTLHWLWLSLILLFHSSRFHLLLYFWNFRLFIFVLSTHICLSCHSLFDVWPIFFVLKVTTQNTFCMYPRQLITKKFKEAVVFVAVVIGSIGQKQHQRLSVVTLTKVINIVNEGRTASATVFDRKPRLVSAATQVVIRRRSTNKDKHCLDSCIATSAPAVHELKHSWDWFSSRISRHQQHRNCTKVFNNFYSSNLSGGEFCLRYIFNWFNIVCWEYKNVYVTMGNERSTDNTKTTLDNIFILKQCSMYIRKKCLLARLTVWLH